jgi:hypothetical protein
MECSYTLLIFPHYNENIEKKRTKSKLTLLFWGKVKKKVTDGRKKGNDFC